MSRQWNEGYFTDFNYTYGYYRELNPLFQRFCMLLKGVWSEPLSTEAAHCELGFGQGLSFNIHAATNPGKFYGNDFNPSQALHAQTLSTQANLNTSIYDCSFAQFLTQELPDFDSISLHGIWSWVSSENRQYLLEIVRKKLKVGGQLYVSYNSMPGWAAAAPLRQLFKIHNQYINHTADSLAGISQALDFSEKVLNLNPKYLLEAPFMKQRLERLRKQDPSYIAHEYFNDEWTCMYFADVAQLLESSKVEFIGTADPGDCLEALNLSADALQYIATIPNPIAQEQLKDYFVSRQFRKDIYAKGKRLLSLAERTEALRKTRFALMVEPKAIPEKLVMPLGEIGLKQEIYRPIIDFLASNHFAPKTIDEITIALPNLPLGQCLDAFIVLAHFSYVAPCHPKDLVPSLRAKSDTLNKAILERAQFNGNISYLASPVIGGGIAVNRFEQLFMVALRQGMKKESELAQYVFDIIAKQGQRVLKDGKPIESTEDNLAILSTNAKEFLSGKLEILKALQVY